MGLFSRFEDKAGDIIEGSAGSRGGGIEPVKLAKRADKEMQREKMVGVGHEYAPTLYNVLVSPVDDEHMSGYYPTLAGEVETYLTARANQTGLILDCPPLVRFIVDEGLKKGRFDIIAESVSPSIIEELRREEMAHYGIEEPVAPRRQPAQDRAGQASQHQGYDPFAPSDMQDPYIPGDSAAFVGAAAPTPAVAPLPVQPMSAREDEGYARTEEPRQQRRYPDVTPPVPADQTVMLGASATSPVNLRFALLEYDTDTRHPLIGNRVMVGRETSCDIVISNPSVSRRHAEILHDTGGWVIRDLGSTNGTSINGAPVTQSQIFDGDVVSLGNAQLEFQES